MGAKETITLRTVNYWFDRLVKIDPNGVVAGRKFYVMFNFTQSRDLMLFMFSSRMNWILDSAQYFPNPHIVFRLNWIPFGFLWNPSALSSRSDRICLKQKIPQNCFSPSSKISDHIKSVAVVKTQFDVKLGMWFVWISRDVTIRLSFGIFTEKKDNCANFKIFNCFDRIINNLLYCILKVLVQTFQNYNSFRSTLFSGISDFNKSPKSCKFWSQGSS